jgi:hypothetical protein
MVVCSLLVCRVKDGMITNLDLKTKNMVLDIVTECMHISNCPGEYNGLWASERVLERRMLLFWKYTMIVI